MEKWEQGRHLGFGCGFFIDKRCVEPYLMQRVVVGGGSSGGGGGGHLPGRIGGRGSAGSESSPATAQAALGRTGAGQARPAAACVCARECAAGSGARSGLHGIYGAQVFRGLGRVPKRDRSRPGHHLITGLCQAKPCSVHPSKVSAEYVAPAACLIRSTLLIGKTKYHTARLMIRSAISS